ncbi:MAG: LysM peptidoglycan-binding domain-containing protein [Anaerolineales bacterium]|nr:MAG: LysM peptidoglycan-binding domain-containing protein [Anaerolineales bacterium]
MDISGNKTTGRGRRKSSAGGASQPDDGLLGLVRRRLTALRGSKSGRDWRAIRPLLTRATAHISVVVLAVVVVLVGTAGGSALLAAVSGPQDDTASPSAETPAPMGGELPTPGANGSGGDSIVRLPVPHTTFPERPRQEVEVYTVVAGDTVWGIGATFGITPSSVFWANSDVLEDNIHLLSIGDILHIMPVNGVYHVVEAGDTVASLAERYEVDENAIHNEWNDVEEDRPLRVGQKLVVPGGTRGYLVWEPEWDTRYGSGACPDVGSARGGNGWFEWPTVSRRISGWTFHDPRNPPHTGLDIGLRTGDAIFAADTGTVIYAGGSGGYGNLLVLYHGDGYQTFYAHLSEIYVECGENVDQLEIIGAGGSTGWSSGPHLHFEIRKDGLPVDPQRKLPLS